MRQMRRGARTARLTALAMAVALLVGGCTLSGSDPEPTPATDAAGSSPSVEPSTRPSPQDAPDGPTPEEISADLLALAAAAPPAPVASQTLEIEVSGGEAAQVTVDVLELRRTRDATLLRFQLSSAEPVGLPEYGTFSDRGSPNREFLDRLNLLDAASGVRHYPLSWLRAGTDDPAPPDGPPNSCVCPNLGQSFQLSPTPMAVDVLYGPLPDDVTTVALEAPGELSIPALPVTPAEG